jgi:hypothetical protein
MDSLDFYEELKNHWTLPRVTVLNYSNGSKEMKSFVLFRTFMCELIYQAVQMFPDIIEYTFECTNNYGMTVIKMGMFEDPESPIPDIFTITTKDGYCSISKADVIKMYIANRVPKPDHHKTNMMIDLLYNGGHEPIIKTSYIINPGKISNATKY